MAKTTSKKNKGDLHYLILRHYKATKSKIFYVLIQRWANRSVKHNAKSRNQPRYFWLTDF